MNLECRQWHPNFIYFSIILFMEVQGHRGAGILVPENTIKAFSFAIEHGYDAVEMDLWMTKDKHVSKYECRLKHVDG